ncbi:threonine aldolase family protein [Candidatus Spongiisocius sp.]|uniref:threonine aldolase family protein n=1 Tax=Candidatus Spongiisocius sp. TaxID=3101273 RepID=UPI003B5B68C3
MPNFYSDTQTRPTAEMRATVLEAEVGDEQMAGDPTTTRLEHRVAKLLGKEAALFLPSGTMCNEIAIKVHVDPGDEVIAHWSSHIIGYESGGPAALSGAMIHPLDGPHGIFTGEQVARAIRPQSRYMPPSRLVSIEQTANLGGGAIWPLDVIDQVAEVAHEAGLVTHMDGARLLNAVVATGIPAARMAEGMDSVWIDLTKGLGAGVGAVIAGSQDFIERAWRWKQQWGGAMRQSGILAAMGLYALDHHVDRMADDHARAARIGAALAGMAQVESVLPVETNIVIFRMAPDGPGSAELIETAREAEVLISPRDERTCRIVTHLDVDDDDVDDLLEVMASALDRAVGA